MSIWQKYHQLYLSTRIYCACLNAGWNFVCKQTVNNNRSININENHIEQKRPHSNHTQNNNYIVNVLRTYYLRLLLPPVRFFITQKPQGHKNCTEVMVRNYSKFGKVPMASIQHSLIIKWLLEQIHTKLELYQHCPWFWLQYILGTPCVYGVSLILQDWWPSKSGNLK